MVRFSWPSESSTWLAPGPRPGSVEGEGVRVDWAMGQWDWGIEDFLWLWSGPAGVDPRAMGTAGWMGPRIEPTHPTTAFESSAELRRPTTTQTQVRAHDECRDEDLGGAIDPSTLGELERRWIGGHYSMVEFCVGRAPSRRRRVMRTCTHQLLSVFRR